RASDVSIVGDVTAAEVRQASAEAAAKIKELVGAKGAGLMMIGGRHNFANGGWERTELRDVLPIDMKAAGEVEALVVKLTLTDAGKKHFLLRLADDAAANEAIWRNDLGLRGGVSRMGQAKNAVGDVLLRSEGGDDILVAGNFGAGRAIAFAG